MKKLILKHRRALGDIVTMTALVRDIHLTYPDKYLISVETPFKDVWLHNPHIVSFSDRRNIPQYNLSYGKGIPKAGREKIHFITAWHEDFKEKTGIEVPVHYPKPDIHLTKEEKKSPIVNGRYWVIVAGGKKDFTTKHWVYSRHQEIVDTLIQFGIKFVQVGAKDKGPPAHFQPELNNVLDLVGKTNVRELINLIYHSDGVICTITAAMHIAAAFDKPCIITAGGREEWWWESYTNAANQFGKLASGKVKVEHKFLHTIGLLSCCQKKGCWKNKVTKDEKDGNKSYCHYPVKVENKQTVPMCMDMVTTEKVVESVLSYYHDGTLKPLEEK